MDRNVELENEAERVRQSGALVRSGTIKQLFDHFVAAALVGHQLSEMGIASDVFGKPENFDLSQDATVRVYVHRLRQKLAKFYDDANVPADARLVIPKGEYRILLGEPLTIGSVASAPSRMRLWLSAALFIALALNIVGWWAFWPHDTSSGLVEVRKLAPWAQLLGDDRPVTIVVGDYYIFGERDPAQGTDRLIRDYAINSAKDLDQRLIDQPTLKGRYQDLGLSYLPEASAFALRELVPLVVRSDRPRFATRVIMASQLTPLMLKTTNIVYVGYFSGLGMLRHPVFAASRFSIGTTWDEIVDDKTGRTFVSGEGGPERANARSRDYGYLSSFSGPGGNRIIVIAGARDMGVRQVAEFAARVGTLEQVARMAGEARDFEALYEVEGIDRQNLAGSLLLAAPITAPNPRAKVFPDR